MARKDQNKQEKKVRIRVLPLKGIGGIGDAGATAWMSQAEADQWVKDGYVEILPDADEPVPSSVATGNAETEPESTEEDDGVEENHAIMKPQSKRD